MASSGMLRRLAVVRTDVSEESRATIIRLTRIGELGTTLVVTSNQRTVFADSVTLLMEALRSSETSVITRATGRNILEEGTLRSQRRQKPHILHSIIAELYF
jgi:hypothetical protein